METIKLTYPHYYSKDQFKETVAAIGFFDGIHRGHQSVIKEAVKLAKGEQKESAVITFDPHPSVVLSNDVTYARYITPFHEKVKLIESLGVDRLYIIAFNSVLSQLSPKMFLEEFIEKLHVTHLVAGFDFTFGYMGKGNMNNINEFLSDNIRYTTMNKLEENNEKISSTKIRQLLKEGKVEQAELLLGHELTAVGKVINGDQRGRTIGYPTANLNIDNSYLLPKIGVYAVKVYYKDCVYNGMANLGYNPTFHQELLEPKVEVHILDFDHSIYDEEIKISWKKNIRGEIKFSGIEALVEQLKKDETVVREFFN
ncbi:riboflavin biosynthesis protein RibF [Saliterribacillus persicus]|uniref:Riboflavin biosynthesis protein n=1 Tax=Saliterribacillus persicus TaxID=930114 RepID=A0A368XRJ4_9BACI|nr:riboflavin biosynthesis protein RibF [Saliterribacillus persicus]RCW70670.1 FMN adenylyltransferase /riboflavin kinase [Saliterribacillus persicus]